VTLEQFAELTPGLDSARRTAYLPLLLAAARDAEIITAPRLAAFLAQLLHESGGLRYFEEIWGPTPAQLRYQGRQDLGNVHPGDGLRFKGRGPIQITGRANYAHYGLAIGVDLIAEPALAAQPAIGFKLAAAYWNAKKLNQLADLQTKPAFVTITRRINGGINGLEDRLARWKAAKRVLGV
jgi:putative chitinase